MSRLIRSLSTILLWVTVAFDSGSACAAGATGEEEALAALSSGRYPLTLSADGRWILHVDANHVLHRKQIGNAKTHDSFAFGESIHALSADQSGKKVAYVTNGGCAGLVMFSEITSTSASALDRAPSQVWLDRSLIDPTPNAGRCPVSISTDDGNWRLYEAYAVALSGDGKLIAVAGRTVKVVEVASRRIIHEIPTGNANVLHMRFLDSNRKLLVVQALMGEQWEAEATGSDMQFLIWDLRLKDLFNFHNTATAGTLINYDLLWSYSETSGELWAINTDGLYWQRDQRHPQGQKRASIRPHTRNLKQCGAPSRPAFPLPPGNDDGWLGFAADPLGRYIAGVTPTFNEKSKRATSTLWVRDTQTGKLLTEWRLNDELRSLMTSRDGRLLFGITAGQPKADQLAYTRYAWYFTGGGNLMKFDLSKKIAALPALEAASWPDQRCRIEDEEENARNIVVGAEAIEEIFAVRLGDYPRRSDCLGQDSSQTDRGKPKAWRHEDDGSLVIDGGNTLERIDGQTGKVLQELPTPRSDSVCSLPIYEGKQFLSWQGDTITMRPFAERLVSTDRKVLVRKPGWIARSVEFLGDRFGVRWIDSRYAKGEGEHGEGSAVAIEYDMSGKRLKQTLGRAIGGNAVFEMEDGEGATSVFSPGAAANPERGPYRWERSYLGSVRAYRRAPSGAYSTVLWAGLQFAKDDPRSQDTERDLASRTDNWVTGLGGSLGANVDTTGVTIYDAATRLQVGRVSAQEVRSLSWNPVSRVLVIETGGPDHPTWWKLTAYRIKWRDPIDPTITVQ